VNYDSSARGDSLASYLLARGGLTSQTHDEMLAMMGNDALSPGAALVAVGAVDAGEPLLNLLRDYVRTKVGEAYAMREGRFSFYEGAEFSSEVPTLDLPALAPMYEAARHAWPTRAFAVALAKHMKGYPARTPEFGKDLAALGLSTADLKLALSISGRRTLREHLAEARDLKHALALFWFLTVTGTLACSPTPTESGPAYGAGTGDDSGNRKRKKLPEPQANELREEAIRILTASYFRVLGLDITADGEAVERAYHETVTRFHPDSYPDYDVGPIEDLLQSVRDRIGAAYRVLSEEEKRKAYLSYLLSRAEVPRVSSLNAEAEIALKRGENQMKRGDWKGALVAFENAVSLNAREPEYYSYLAWATFKAGSGDRAQRARTASKLLKKALAMNPNLERVQVIAAILEDEVGDPAEARRMLLKVLKANPESELAKKTLQGLSRRRGAGERG